MAEDLEWGYGFVDSFPAAFGPISEETARRKAAEDLSVVLLCREVRTDGTTTVWAEVTP